ncbi:MAG: hypothetical protein LBB86_01010 [Oscillospiraceae bacterium]|nr:hypothetical protein [Oscillospiraceae bacterium]
MKRTLFHRIFDTRRTAVRGISTTKPTLYSETWSTQPGIKRENAGLLREALN